MADLYGDFEEGDDDEDIGALGSILSWDGEEDVDVQGGGMNQQLAAMSAALRDRENGTGGTASAPPPDMVQFSNTKDGLPQFNFLFGNAGNTSSGSLMGGGSERGDTNAAAAAPVASNSATNYVIQAPQRQATPAPPPPVLPQQIQQQEQQQQVAQNGTSLTMRLPMPTPVADLSRGSTALQQKPQQQAQTVGAAAPSTVVGAIQIQQQQAPAAATAQSQQQNLAANFAQLLAQQASNLFQQQPQQQNTAARIQPQVAAQRQPMQQQQTQAQQQQAQLLQQTQQLLSQQQRQQQAQPQQVAAQQPQGQAQPAKQVQQQPAPTPASAATPQAQTVQLPFTADPNAFLQQLQFAQFQHQLQVQAQQQQQQQQQQAAQQQAAQQRQAVVTAAAPKTSLPQYTKSPAPTPVVSAPIHGLGPPPPKKAKTTSTNKAPKQPPPRKLSTPSTLNPTSIARAASAPSSAAGIVSASDTDGEASKRRSSAIPLIATKKSEPIDTSNMTTEEKAKANRDRNREHARNTRLRKKAYLEKLKATVDELCRERDTLVSERAGAANLLVEMHNTRTEVLMSFFALRSANEKRRKLWSSILDESCFTCLMPVTPYRSFPASEVQVSKCQRTLLGIDAMISDTSSLHVLMASLVDRARFPNGKIQFRYTLVTEESVIAGNQMMARWVLSTTNAVQNGARMEVAKQGMLCCKFNSAHRITGLELMFDVMAFMLQLKQAAGSESFSVIPNTVQTCQRTLDKPMVMTLAEPPYTIVQVNKLWEDMTGYTAEEVVGKTSCSILQGDATDRKAVSLVMDEIRFKRPTSSVLVNVKKTGEKFRHSLVFFPLSTDSRITHYLALSNHVDSMDDSTAQDSKPPAVPQQIGTASNSQQQAPSTQPQPAAPQPSATTTSASQAPIVSQPSNMSAGAAAAAAAHAPAAVLPQMLYTNPTPMVLPPQPQQPLLSTRVQVSAPAGVMAPPVRVPGLTPLQHFSIDAAKNT